MDNPYCLNSMDYFAKMEVDLEHGGGIYKFKPPSYTGRQSWNFDFVCFYNG